MQSCILQQSHLQSKGQDAYIEKDGVVISIAIVAVHAVEALRELDVAHPGPVHRVHQETHGLPHEGGASDGDGARGVTQERGKGRPHTRVIKRNILFLFED
jgi:hypothetical protein